MKRYSLFLVLLLFLFLFSGCVSAQNIEERILETLSEKYPECSFTVQFDSDTGHYQVTDQNDISFEVSVIKASSLQFLCKDSYIGDYLLANGLTEQVNEVLTRYNLSEATDLTELEIDWGNLDDSQNMQTAAQFMQELSDCCQLPFEISYFWPDSMETSKEYIGSQNGGLCGFDVTCTFDSGMKLSDIPDFLDWETLNSCHTTEEWADYLENIHSIEQNDEQIAAALDPDFYETTFYGKTREEYDNDEFEYFMSINALGSLLYSVNPTPIQTAYRDGWDQEGYPLLYTEHEDGQILVTHLKPTGDTNYGYACAQITDQTADGAVL